MIDRYRRLADRIGLHAHVLLVVMLVVVGGTWGFIALADEVGEGDTLRFDEFVLRAMRNEDGNPIGPPWVEGAARDVTALGGVAVLTLVTLSVVAYLILLRKYHAMWLVVGASAGGLILSSALKHWVARERPGVVIHLQTVYSYSFPSGHSMMSSAIYLTLGSLLARFVPERRAKVYFLVLSLILTFLIGVSRVYLGVHYPTDVLAGWTAGLVWALICWLVARFLQQHGAVERDYEEKPARNMAGQ